MNETRTARVWLVSERTMIRGVVEAWAEQYPDRRQVLMDGEAAGDIEVRLEALNLETATADDVAEIIGNRSWTRVVCDSCGAEGGPVVRMGDEPDYDAKTFDACEQCLRAALSLLP